MLLPMDLNELAKLLAAYKRGELETNDALSRIKNLQFEDIGFARVDHARATRQGYGAQARQKNLKRRRT